MLWPYRYERIYHLMCPLLYFFADRKYDKEVLIKNMRVLDFLVLRIFRSKNYSYIT